MGGPPECSHRATTNAIVTCLDAVMVATAMVQLQCQQDGYKEGVEGVFDERGQNIDDTANISIAANL